MKQIITLFIFCACTSLQAQKSADTTAVWVVYLDSVRLFAAAPTYDMRVEVLPGWKVRNFIKNGNDLSFIDYFYNQDGVAIPEEIVLYFKPRKIVNNPFRQ